MTVGFGSASSNNYFIVGGASTAVTLSNVAITVGTNGSAYNTMTVTNANMWSAGLTIGSGGSNNTVTIQDTNLWNFGGGAITIDNRLTSPRYRRIMSMCSVKIVRWASMNRRSF